MSEPAAPPCYRLLILRRFWLESPEGRRLARVGVTLSTPELRLACHLVAHRLARPADAATALDVEVALTLRSVTPRIRG